MDQTVESHPRRMLLANCNRKCTLVPDTYSVDVSDIPLTFTFDATTCTDCSPAIESDHTFTYELATQGPDGCLDDYTGTKFDINEITGVISADVSIKYASKKAKLRVVSTCNADATTCDPSVVNT